MQITTVGKPKRWAAWMRWIEWGAQIAIVLTNGAIIYLLARLLGAV